jgi:hypothetical protein
MEPISTKRKIADLREALFDVIEGVKDGKIDVDRARTITSIAQVIVNSAKVEVDFIQAIGHGKGTGFIGEEVKQIAS